MKPDAALIEAIAEVLGCKPVPYDGNKYDKRCLAHWARPWTDRGCPVAATAARAAYAALVEHLGLTEETGLVTPWTEIQP
ncbi:MAG: hypothetical protein ACXVGC_00245 [Mycobacteriaceae bacterium]